MGMKVASYHVLLGQHSIFKHEMILVNIYEHLVIWFVTDLTTPLCLIQSHLVYVIFLGP